MTELDTIKRAKMYMDKLADGIDPISDAAAPEGDIIHQARMSRCFSYVSDVLQRLIEQGGFVPAAGVPKIPFSLPCENRDLFAFSKEPLSVSEIAKRLNDLTDHPAMKRITYRVIAEWLIEAGMLTLADAPSGKQQKRPTPEGKALGITLEERMGSQGPYQALVYNTQAQHFILDNLDAILEAERARTELQGTPWTREDDDRLREFCQKGLSPRKIAPALKRNSGEIRARARKLGLVKRDSDT